MDVENEKTVSFFRFEDLRIYHKAIEYSTMICNSFVGIDTDAKKKLVKEFTKTSFEISLYTIEGTARTKNQFETCLKQAKTAVRQCVFYSEMSLLLGIIDKDTYDKSYQTLKELTKMLGALIISLQKGQQRRNGYNSENEVEKSYSDFTLDIENGMDF